jgi:hypothetical protein
MADVENYTGEVIRLALLAGGEGAIRDKEFADCDLHGPAVLFLGDDATVSRCQWDGDMDSVLWVIPANRTRITGAIHVERTTFVGCRFRKVGIAVPEAAVAQVRAGFGG